MRIASSDEDSDGEPITQTDDDDTFQHTPPKNLIAPITLQQLSTDIFLTTPDYQTYHQSLPLLPLHHHSQRT